MRGPLGHSPGPRGDSRKPLTKRWAQSAEGKLTGQGRFRGGSWETLNAVPSALDSMRGPGEGQAAATVRDKRDGRRRLSSAAQATAGTWRGSAQLAPGRSALHAWPYPRRTRPGGEGGCPSSAPAQPQLSPSGRVAEAGLPAQLGSPPPGEAAWLVLGSRQRRFPVQTPVQLSRGGLSHGPERKEKTTCTRMCMHTPPPGRLRKCSPRPTKGRRPVGAPYSLQLCTQEGPTKCP